MPGGAQGSLTWEGAIALMYASDYGYAANLANCSNYLTEYNYKHVYQNTYNGKTIAQSA